MDLLLRELRYTGRTLAARPGWTAAAILCLAIATGANTAAFTVVNGLLLRPLPFDDPDALVMVALREPTQAGPRPFALGEYRELADRSGTTIQLLARTFFPLSLVADDGARMAQAELVSGNYFETLRVTPFLGRFFDSGADRSGSAPRAVLSHRLWRLRFEANPAIVGQAVRVNGRPVVVAGIAPPAFFGAMQLVAADLWLPASVYPDLAGSADADTVPMFGVIGRMAPHVTVTDAEARLTALVATVVGARGANASPAVIVTPAAGFGVPPAAHGTVLTLSGFIYVMMALLMAVACANVAALVLARGVGRTREIAIRVSLGCSRLQICVHCGAPHAPEARFCASCGAGLVPAVEPSPASPPGTTGDLPSLTFGGLATASTTFRGYYLCSAVKLVVMSTFTFDVYLIYWFYQQWKREQERWAEPISPLWRTVFLPIFVYPLGDRVRQAARERQIPASYSPALVAAVYIGLHLAVRLPDPYWWVALLAPAALLPILSAANRVSAAINPASIEARDFSRREIALMVPGAILFALALLGSALPEEP